MRKMAKIGRRRDQCMNTCVNLVAVHCKCTAVRNVLGSIILQIRSKQKAGVARRHLAWRRDCVKTGSPSFSVRWTEMITFLIQTPTFEWRHLHAHQLPTFAPLTDSDTNWIYHIACSSLRFAHWKSFTHSWVENQNASEAIKLFIMKCCQTHFPSTAQKQYGPWIQLAYGNLH